MIPSARRQLEVKNRRRLKRCICIGVGCSDRRGADVRSGFWKQSSFKSTICYVTSWSEEDLKLS
eukprot:4067270-Prorocentrum_lima.AAC.1